MRTAMHALVCTQTIVDHKRTQGQENSKTEQNQPKNLAGVGAVHHAKQHGKQMQTSSGSKVIKMLQRHMWHKTLFVNLCSWQQCGHTA